MQVDHFALVVPEIEPAIQLFTGALGGSVTTRKRIEAKMIDVAFIDIGGSSFEIIAPWGPGTNYFDFLTAHGPGFHHVAFRVDELGETMEHLLEAGVHPDGPADGTGTGRAVQWLKPADTLGAVMQLIHFQK